MNEILGKAKTVRELLKGVKYSIDYYQREYRWGQKQVLELLADLTNKFLEQYEETHARKDVEKYPHYFLGSIIISSKESGKFIVDGQQRLTSLTLLLILLRNLQRGREDQVNVDELIYSEKYGEKSFNLNVPERDPCLNALFDNQLFDPNGAPESVHNIYERYHDLEEFFRKQQYNTLDSEFDVIYVNGDNNLMNIPLTPACAAERGDAAGRPEKEGLEPRYKVRLIEEEFKRLMFEVGDV